MEYNSHNMRFLPYILADHDRVKEVSYAFTDMTGYSRNDILGRDITEVFRKLLKIYSNVHDLKFASEDNSFFIFTKSLVAREVSVIIRRGMEYDEQVYIFLEKPYSRLEEKFPFVEQLSLQNIVGVAIFSVPDITLLKANQTFLNFLDEPFNIKENSIGQQISSIVTGWLGSSSEDIWKSFLQTGNAFHSTEYMYDRFKRGNTYWNTILTPVYEGSRMKYAVEITMDMTQNVNYRKKIEEQSILIKQQKRQLEAVIENMSEGLFVIDKNYRVTFLNHAARELFFMPDELKSEGDSLKHTEYYDTEGNLLQLKDMPTYKILRGDAVKLSRLVAKRPDKTVHLNISGSPVYDSEGNIEMAIICGRDITEYVKNEERLKAQQESLLAAEKAEKKSLEEILRMKDEFFSFISHEFKTPITVILSAIQTMESLCGDKLPKKASEFVKRIRQNTLRQLRLVNNLLDITRAESGYIKVHKKNMDIVAITKAITDSVAIYANEKNLKINFSSRIKTREIGMDDEKYERILLNLLSNAIKFTPEGKLVCVNILQVGDYIHVEVKDEGIGIPPEKHSIIFDRFGQVDSSLTRKSEGTGIGLCLVKLLAEAMGGKIVLDSIEGIGSTFTLILPINKAPDLAEDYMQPISDNRLIQTVAIEFSDIYI